MEEIDIKCSEQLNQRAIATAKLFMRQQSHKEDAERTLTNIEKTKKELK
ncbi:MAG: hypothetical protein QMC77_03600 [Methanocellales archaeon]|nr:hypothetical protein [Methanocellales archaeon]